MTRDDELRERGVAIIGDARQRKAISTDEPTTPKTEVHEVYQFSTVDWWVMRKKSDRLHQRPRYFR